MKEKLETHFAPAKRKSLEEIREEAKEFFKTYFEEILNSIPNITLIVNEERQVVFLNKTVINLFGIKNIEEAIGSRPGEIIKCIHSQDYIHGCGTGQNCRYCGAVNAVLQSLETNERIISESRITSNFHGNLISFDLNVTAQPFSLKGKKFVMVFLSDISNQKRQELLEMTFLHDLLNILTVITGFIEIFPLEGLNAKQKEYFGQIRNSVQVLVEEFLAQRDLKAAEKNELMLNFKNQNSLGILIKTIELIKNQNVANEKEIELDSNSTSVIIKTDARLLSRILLNLLKNALEASVPGESVRIGCNISNQTIIFWVKNSTVLTESVKSQMFQRSFSTKGPGRGIGTYSVKLLTERYLGGKVSFQSSKEEGTIFYVH
ncbi:MAG: ATP-binding protein, partial [Candidatus Hermodarchaeota archaeon]